MQPLNIAVLSDWEASGGANIAAVRLTQGFAEAGHRVTRIYQKAAVDNPRYETRLIRSHWATNELSAPRRLAWKLVPEGLHQRLHERSSEAQLARILEDVRPDVINVHNLHIGRWSPEMLRVCAAHAPVICKLCDTWMLTGRCYNPGDCDRYLTQCDHECPTASEYPMLKPSKIRAAFDLRREILDQSANIVAIAPSRWIGRMAVAGIWKRRPVFNIRNGIDLAVYTPVGQKAAQSALRLRPEDPVLLCSVTQLTNRKKGLPQLLEALAKGVGRRVQLLLLGTPAALPAIPEVDIHQMGYVENDRLKALLYNASDMCIHPSIADNSPNSVIEALACGTPVLAFPVDGLPEMVIQGQTGWLAAGVSADFLNTAIRQALQDLRNDVDLRKTCRQFAESHYDMPQVIRSYERVIDYIRTGVAADLPERFSPADGRPELTELVTA